MAVEIYGENTICEIIRGTVSFVLADGLAQTDTRSSADTVLVL